MGKTEPTVQPTSVPTHAPTFFPTPYPTHPPTHVPIPLPTPSPTHAPTTKTWDPTPAPTRSPLPTARPTPSETVVEKAAHLCARLEQEQNTLTEKWLALATLRGQEWTRHPTDVPTLVPTHRPSLTSIPSRSPTHRPSLPAPTPGVATHSRSPTHDANRQTYPPAVELAHGAAHLVAHPQTVYPAQPCPYPESSGYPHPYDPAHARAHACPHPRVRQQAQECAQPGRQFDVVAGLRYYFYTGAGLCGSFFQKTFLPLPFTCSNHLIANRLRPRIHPTGSMGVKMINEYARGHSAQSDFVWRINH